MKAESTRQKLLIVDDAPENIHILMECLSDEYATVVAKDGENALRLANTDPVPDIILLDIRMPGMDGHEVCARLKSNKKTAAIPVIFVSALEDEVEEHKGLDLGAVDYIHKPYSPTLVRARIRNHLELKRHRDHLEDLIQERTRELDLTRSAVIYGLGILAEYRDPETGRHLKRTQYYVRLLSLYLKNNPRFRGYFDDATIRMLYNSAPLHDIGKVGVSDSILNKPGSLTADEFDAMKMHTVFGRDTIFRIEAGMRDKSASAFLSFAKELCYTHHERWDGTGYHALKGEEIPVASRLMALSDIYDALTSKRVYKQALPHSRAFEIITQGDGRTMPEHFDPDIVQAFIDLHERFEHISNVFRDQDDMPESLDLLNWKQNDHFSVLPARELHKHQKHGAVDKQADFKKCPSCFSHWNTRDDFLSDPALELNGYKANFNEPEFGQFSFTHNKSECISTMALEAWRFTDMYGGKRYPERKALSQECPRFCLDEKQLGRCSAECDCAYLREVIQVTLQRQKTSKSQE